MKRKNIFEIIADKYNIKEEISKIDTLFSNALLMINDHLHFQQSQGNAEGVVNTLLFYDWRQRGTCLTCQEMREKLGINIEKFSNKEILKRLEYYLNIINLVNIKLTFPNYQKTQQFVMLEKNIDILLEHLNYERLYTDDEKVLLVPKNAAAISVAEISSKETGVAILMYNHASLKGDLNQKRSLLLKIYLENEQLLKKVLQDFLNILTKHAVLLTS